MVSVTGITENHTLQPSLEEKHKETLNWLSFIKLWQKELAFFQTILDGTGHYFESPEDKKKLSRFQNLFMYYHAELLLELRTKLRNHESNLAKIFSRNMVNDNPYYSEHDPLMAEMGDFSKHFSELKKDFFTFIEKIK
ncbi:MAG: hypothetical protein WA874_06970 [Chryseosolibacter sp.]